jgi:hypothetical protein
VINKLSVGQTRPGSHSDSRNPFASFSHLEGLSGIQLMFFQAVHVMQIGLSSLLRGMK